MVVFVFENVKSAAAADPFTDWILSKLAGVVGLGAVTANIFTFAAQVIGYIAGFIGGIFITVAMYLMLLAMNINKTLLSSSIVQNGWNFTLSFANLGFVFGIIIVAFATILRLQSYAMKQILWKLIVAALLVNFSLVIAGAFMSVSDVFSDAILGIGGFSGGIEGIIKNPLQWSNAFGNMLGQQKLLNLDAGKCQWDASEAEKVCATVFSDCRAQGTSEQECRNLQTQCIKQNMKCVTNPNDSQKWAELKGSINEVSGEGLKMVASSFFIALFTILATITLLAIAVMLLIRYVYLGILLILSPIVWLFWIFPATVGSWQKWWKKFLQWTFFTPIMLFFIVLAKRDMDLKSFVGASYDSNTIAAIGGNDILTFGLGVIGDMVIVLGLLMGGLMAASALSITGSGLALKMAQKAGKKFGAWSGRKAALPLGAKWFKDEKGEKTKSLADKFAASKMAKGWYNPLAWASKGVSRLAAEGTDRNVKHYEGAHKDKSAGELRTALNTATGAELIAILKLLDKLDKTTENDLVNNKSLFSRYGQGKSFEGMENSLFTTAESVPLIREAAQIEKSNPNYEKDSKYMGIMAKLKDQNKTLISRLSKSDISKGRHDDINAEQTAGFDKEENKIRRNLVNSGFLRYRPEAVGIIMGGTKGKNQERLNESLEDGSRQIIRESLRSVTIEEEIDIDGEKVQLLGDIWSKIERNQKLLTKEWKAFLKWSENNSPTAYKQVGLYRKNTGRALWESFQGAAGGTATT